MTHSNRCSEGEHRRKRHRDGRQHSNQKERFDLRQWKTQDERVYRHHDADAAIEHRKIPYDTENGLLLGALDVSFPYEVNASAETSSASCRSHLSKGLATSDH